MPFNISGCNFKIKRRLKLALASSKHWLYNAQGNLRQSVAAVNNHVSSGRICRGIAGKVQVQALDLLDMSLPPQDGHSVRLVLDCPSCGAHAGVEEARRNAVYASKLSPLAG